MPCACRV